MAASSRGALRCYCEKTPTPRQENYSSLCERAAGGDKHSLAAIEEQARAIGRGLRMVLASLAPGLILLSGEVSRIWPIAGDIIRRECAHGVLGGTAPRLRLASFGEDAQLLGAAAVVLQRHYSYYRAQGFVSRSPS